jgi:hypothetical protein
LLPCDCAFVDIHIYGPDLFTSGLFLGLKSGLPVGLGGAVGPVRPQAGLTQPGNPDFNPKNRSWWWEWSWH